MKGTFQVNILYLAQRFFFSSLKKIIYAIEQGMSA